MAVYTVARATTATQATAASSEEDAKTFLERNPRCVLLSCVGGEREGERLAFSMH